MNKVNWKQKLTSRKLWAAVAAAGYIIITEGLGYEIDSNTYWQVVAVASSYIIGESIVDANRTIVK